MGNAAVQHHQASDQIMKMRNLRRDELHGLGYTDDVEGFLLGKVIEDENGQIIMSGSAYFRAEVHMKTAEWGTPSARWLLLQHLHREMEKELHQKGCTEVVTWFDKAETFCKRLKMLGWGQSPRVMWARKVHNG